MSSIEGKTVVRKCCELDEIFSLDYRKCLKDKEGQTTQFFDDLRARENDSLFFRIGLLLQCQYDRLHARKFELTSNGSLQVEADEDGHNWSHQLFSTDNYCVEDFVLTNSFGLPETSNLALFCAEQPPLELSELESTDDTGSAIHEIRYEELEKVDVPKCCTSGSVIVHETCQPIRTIDETLDAELIVANALNFHLLNSFNFSSTLIPNVSLSCGFGKRYPFIPATGNSSEGMVKFRAFKKNDQLSILLHFFVENYWDFDVKLQSFCLDLELLRSLKETTYNPQIFYCVSHLNVSKHYPILLGISSAALLATFIIYFFVPTSGNNLLTPMPCNNNILCEKSGSAKLVTMMGASHSRRNTVPTMAMMLTGRILLCHVISLAAVMYCVIPFLSYKSPLFNSFFGHRHSYHWLSLRTTEFLQVKYHALSWVNSFIISFFQLRRVKQFSW